MVLFNKLNFSSFKIHWTANNVKLTESPIRPEIFTSHNLENSG